MRALALLVACLALLAGSAWLLFQEQPSPEGLEGPALEREVPAAPADTHLPSVPEAPPAEEPASLESDVAEASGRESVPLLEEETERTQQQTFNFVGALVLPDHSEVKAGFVRAELREEGGEVHLFEGTDTRTISFSDVEFGRYELLVEAPGYRHERCDLVLHSLLVDIPTSSSAAPSISEHVVLWPETWIPVVVLTPDGKPFRSIADDLGWEAENLFMHAFEARASRTLAVSGDPLPPTDEELATWRPAPGYHHNGYENIELPGSVAGSLELHVDLPLWIGLWFHGQVQEGRVLRVGDRRVVFSVDLEALERGMASLQFQLVDRESGAPVRDAVATLTADRSAHRRADLSEQVPDAEGGMRFARLIPGQYGLTILREGQIVQRRFELESGEAKDLGVIQVASGPGLQVRVVDREGASVAAWVGIGPYRPGADVGMDYSPDLERLTDGDGRYELPVPDRHSVLRVREYGRSGNTCSRNYLIDPEDLPAELVVLVEDCVVMRVDPRTSWVAGQRVEFVDDLDLIVGVASGEENEELDVILVPGSYTARRWDGETLVGELAVEVLVGQEVVSCP